MKQIKNLKKLKNRSLLTESEIQTLYARLEAANPFPKTELNYHNTYTLLVAVALSAQMTDKGVNKATKSLFKIIHSPQDMLNLGEEKLKEYIKTINFYPTKARNLIVMAQKLVEEFNGVVPSTRKELESLAGVGRKTANVVLSIAFDQVAMAVDTHVFRVSNRTGLAPGKTPAEVEEVLMTVTPQACIVDAHHWLILHGRYVCKARKPDCHICLISDICKAFKNQTR